MFAIQGGPRKSKLGFIDVNGLSGPNREVQCATGTTMDVTNPNYSGCSVDNRTIGDIYPIIY